MKDSAIKRSRNIFVRLSLGKYKIYTINIVSVSVNFPNGMKIQKSLDFLMDFVFVRSHSVVAIAWRQCCMVFRTSLYRVVYKFSSYDFPESFPRGYRNRKSSLWHVSNLRKIRMIESGRKSFGTDWVLFSFSSHWIKTKNYLFILSKISNGMSALII